MRNIIFATILLFAFPALAETPIEIAPYIHAQTPYGTGAVNKFMLHVYDATLWTDAEQWSMKEPFALSLKYNMSFDGKDIVKRTIDEMVHVDNPSADQLTHYSDLLMPIFPNVKQGDVITALYLPGKKTVFFYNGKLKGTVTDARFAKPFFDIWLSPKTSEPGTRKQLLSGS